MKNSWNFKTSIGDLHLKLIDVILQKCYLKSIWRQSQSSRNQTDEVAIDEEIIQLLASVDFCWFQRITRRRFKNVIWSKMKKHYEDTYRLYFIYKSNQQFFEEVPQIIGKTNMTPSTAYLRTSESEKRNRRRRLKKRQIENRMLRTAFLSSENKDVFKDFLRSYDAKEQELIREIICFGGVVARVEIKMTRPLTEFEQIPQQLEAGVVILTSCADRDVVLWIWCHSNIALQKLNRRDGLKKLIEIVRQSVKATSDVLVHRTSIDCDHLNKKIVWIPWEFVDFRTTLSFKRETHSESRSSYSDIFRVIEVTKLKMKIYVLCMIRSRVAARNWSVSTMICVFEDRSPYPIVEEISLGLLDSCSRARITKKFKSIVACAKDNCLYLLRSSVEEQGKLDEVIRVEIKENEENSLQQHSNWLALEEGFHPHVLSISRDEDLMMVNSSSPIILRIYNSDAKLPLSVNLNKDILKTLKAVETSNRNFIILHSIKRPTEDADDGVRAKETNEEDRDFVWTVSEVSRDGTTIIRRFNPQNQQQQLNIPYFFGGGDLCTDSEGRVFVVDTDNDRIIVLDSYLRWIVRLILTVEDDDENEKLRRLLKFFYDESSKEMVVAGENEVHIYDLIC